MKTPYVSASTFFNYFAVIAAFLLFVQPGFSQSSENQQILFEGTLTDTSGNPISLAGEQLNFYITANGCYLYGESSSTSGDSQGNIVHRIGSGTLAPGSPNSFSQNLLFGSVTGTTNFLGNACSVSAADTRLAQVYYGAQNITATIKLGTVPYAQNATMLSGKTATDFVLTSADSITLFSGGTPGQFLTKSASGGLSWTNSNLTAAQITSVLGYTPASASALSAYTQKSNNLSDLASATVARTNLGLGSLAVKSSVNLATIDVTGTLPATNLPGFSGDITVSAGTSVASVTRLRGVALSATAPASGQVLLYNGTNWAPVTIPSNVGTVTNVASTNSDIVITSGSTTPNLTLNVGTSANQIIRLDGSAKLPAVDASQLTSLNATQITSGTFAPASLPAFSGDASTVAGSNTITVNKLRGIAIASATPSTAQVLAYNGSQWAPANAALGSVTNIFTGTGLLGGPITASGTIAINFGASDGTVAAGNDIRIVQALQSVNNLSDITSAGATRANLGLGSLATKSTVNLASDVTGSLPIANGGSPWLTHANGYFVASNTAIGSSTVLANTKLLVEGNSPSQVARFINSSGSGYGVRIDVAGTSSAQYALNVNNGNGSAFAVQNDGNVGINNLSPAAKLHVVGTTEVARFEGNSGGSFISLYGGVTQKGFLGYGSGGALFGNELPNTVGLRSENNLQLGIGSVAQVTITSAGAVGIGTNSPQAKLHVAGSVVSKPQIVAGTSVDLSLSNMFILNSVGGSANSPVLVVLSNMVDGGSYTFIVTDPVAHTYTFSGCNNSYYAPANTLTVAGTRTMFGLVSIKNGSNWDCYINWTPGYQ